MPPAGSGLAHGMSSTSAIALVLAQGPREGCAVGESSHLDARVDAATREASRINLVGAHSAFPVSNLAMQVVELHKIAIHHAQSANSRCCQIHDHWTAQAAHPNHQNGGVAEARLCCTEHNLLCIQWLYRRCPQLSSWIYHDA